jgi:hypothetical protein
MQLKEYFGVRAHLAMLPMFSKGETGTGLPRARKLRGSAGIAARLS